MRLKKKKKFYKRWWFWAIIVFFIAAAGLGNSNEDTNNYENVVISDTVKEDNATKVNESKEKNIEKIDVKEQAEKDAAKIESKNNAVKNNVIVDGNLKVHYIDVGQADSILIQQNGHNMLIDAGNNADSDLVVNYLKKQGVSNLDYVIGTHPHEDHIGGLDAVIKSFTIGKVYMPKATSTTQTYKDVVSAISSKKLKITTPTVGSHFNLGDATATILAPNGSGYEDANNYSIAIKLTYGNNSFLFMGDAEDISENEILSNGQNIKADVLKVGHHGSSSSTTKTFLSKVAPKYAVISVGKDNSYGHPHKSTMDKLKASGIIVYRTDETGTIVATSDGSKITFSTKPGTYSYNGTGSSSNFNTSSVKNSSSSKSNKSTNTTVVPVPKTTTKQSTQTTKPKQSTQTSDNSSTRTVYFTSKGKSYHYSANCKTLSRSKTILSATLNEAINSGHADPCDVCVN